MDVEAGLLAFAVWGVASRTAVNAGVDPVVSTVLALVAAFTAVVAVVVVAGR